MANPTISAKQRAAIRELLTGASYPDAARAAKVHPGTITQWMKNPVFLAELHQAEGEALQAVSRSLVSLADKAASTLEAIIDDPQARDSSKVRAADVVLSKILQIKELVDLENRIKALEDKAYENQP